MPMVRLFWNSRGNRLADRQSRTVNITTYHHNGTKLETTFTYRYTSTDVPKQTEIVIDDPIPEYIVVPPEEPIIKGDYSIITP